MSPVSLKESAIEIKEFSISDNHPKTFMGFQSAQIDYGRPSAPPEKRHNENPP